MKTVERIIGYKRARVEPPACSYLARALRLRLFPASHGKRGLDVALRWAAPQAPARSAGEDLGESSGSRRSF